MIQGASPQFEGTQHNKRVAELAGPRTEIDAAAPLAQHHVTAESLPAGPLSPEPLPALPPSSNGDEFFSHPPSPRCFSCHERGHIARRCPVWAGRCFNCREEGHASRDCKRAPSRRSRSRRDGADLPLGRRVTAPRPPTSYVAAAAGVRHASTSPSPVPHPAPRTYACAAADARPPPSASPFPRPASETPGLSAAVSESVASQLTAFHRALSDEFRLLRDPANSVPASNVVTAVSESVVACLAPLFRLLGDELRLFRESMCTPQSKTPILVGLHSDSKGDASKDAPPPGLECDDDYDADLEAFEAQLVLLSPSPHEHALLHIIEEEGTHRAAVQADCTAFFLGVAAATATSAAAVAHRCVFMPAIAPPVQTGRFNPVVEAETVARRVVMCAGSAALFAFALEMVSELGALAVRATARGRAEVGFFDDEAAARREQEGAETIVRRVIGGDADAALFAHVMDVVSSRGAGAVRAAVHATAARAAALGHAEVQFFDGEAAARREIEVAAFAQFPHVPSDPVVHPVDEFQDLPEEHAETLARESVRTPPPITPVSVGMHSDREPGDATLRNSANAVSATTVVTAVGPVNPAVPPEDDPEEPMEDLAFFHRPSLDTGRTVRKAGAKGGHLPPHRVTQRGEFMRPGDEYADDYGSSDSDAPVLRREALTCPSGHPLTPSALPKWHCDECGACSGDAEESMACRACDYDMCMVCVADTAHCDGSPEPAAVGAEAPRC